MRWVLAPTKKRIAVLAGVVLIGTISTMTLASALTGRSAPITKFVGIDESGSTCTNTTTFVNMPKANKTFIVGGSTSDETVVMFSASMVLHPHPQGTPDLGAIQLTIDDALQAPIDVIALGSTGEQRAVAFNWQTDVLTPGSHTARMQWRTNAGSLFCVAARTMIILSK